MDGRRTSKPNYNYRHRQQHEIFLLLSATILLQNAASVTTKCDYYLLQTAAKHSVPRPTNCSTMIMQ